MTMSDETLGRELAGKVIAFLETGTPPERVFTKDAFCGRWPSFRVQCA